MTFLLLLITLEIIYHVDKTNAREGINIAIVERYSQNLPIKSAGYTLVLAQSSGTTVKMTIISEAGAQTTQTPDAFLTSYQRQMCADPTVKLMITEGINYSITINDTRTGNQYQRKLDRTTCGIVKAHS